MSERLPLLDHPLDSPTVFLPEALVESVRIQRRLEAKPIPEVCILEFDGDLTDWLVERGVVTPTEYWACFHSTMYSLDVEGTVCGIVPRTIGGPYAVLVAEQMAVSGARIVLGLTSAGRVSPKMPVPGLAVATAAVRDEGASYHYLAPSTVVEANSEVSDLLRAELGTIGLPVLHGTVWTTDAPYRETAEQFARYSEAGLLAVEMQAASLFAFSSARNFPVGIVAYVTNSQDAGGNEFDKGSRELQLEILRRVCRAGKRYVAGSGTYKQG